jgi:hypothetical protein
VYVQHYCIIVDINLISLLMELDKENMLQLVNKLIVQNIHWFTQHNLA